VDQRWHHRNRERNTERSLRRRAETRAWLNERKRDAGCSECGITDPACLDYHHRNTGNKSMSVGRMVTFGYGTDGIETETANCEVLCANCHRTEHWQPPTTDRTAWIARQKRRTNGCSYCSEDDPARLDFHHVGEKRGTVARMVVDDRPRSEIRAEIESCSVLCANCHRQRHHEPPDPARYDTHK
jgi:hypothetical protein